MICTFSIEYSEGRESMLRSRKGEERKGKGEGKVKVKVIEDICLLYLYHNLYDIRSPDKLTQDLLWNSRVSHSIPKKGREWG